MLFMYSYNNILDSWLNTLNTLNTGKYSPVLFTPLSPSLSVVKFKTGLIQNNFYIIVLIRKSIDFQPSLGEFKALQITRGENNPVYSR